MAEHSNLADYIEDIHRNPDSYNRKIRQMFVGILEPILKGESDKYYFDPKPGQNFIRFCQGDIRDEEHLNSLLKDAHGADNYEKIDYIERTLHIKCGLIRQSDPAWRGLPLVLMPYQKAYEEAMEGIIRRDNGKRRFTKGYMEIPKKNGKTEWKAAKCIWKLCTVPGINIICTASQYDQAMVLFNSALNMRNANRYLKRFINKRGMPKPELNIFPPKNSNSVPNTAKLNVLPKATQGQDGYRPDYAVIDECHACPDMTMQLISSGMASSPDPELELITTQGIIHPCLNDTLYEDSSKMLNGKIDIENFLAVIYELDDKDDWHSPAIWKKCNPGLGISKSEDYVADLVKEAEANPLRVPEILTKHFNVPGVDSAHVWLNADEINQPITFTPEEISEKFESKTTNAWGGFDLSATSDMTCAGTLKIDKERNVLFWDPHFWVTRHFLDSPIAKSSTVPWQAWIDLGFIEVSKDPFSIIDSDIVEYFLNQSKKHKSYYNKIGFDRWHSEAVVRGLSTYYSRDLILRPINQSFSPEMDAAMKYLLILLRAHRLTYNNNPVMKWCLANLEALEDKGGNLKPNKAAGRKKNKIDGASALLSALAAFYPDKDRFITF